MAVLASEPVSIRSVTVSEVANGVVVKRCRKFDRLGVEGKKAISIEVQRMPYSCERAVTRQSVPKREGVPIAALAAALCCACAVAQTAPALKEGTVYNRPVYFVANDKLEVAVVKQGGSMLRILIQGDSQGLSPFGNPEMVPQVPDNRKLQGPMEIGRAHV